jgi:hypothetical protein
MNNPKVSSFLGAVAIVIAMATALGFVVAVVKGKPILSELTSGLNEVKEQTKNLPKSGSADELTGVNNTLTTLTTTQVNQGKRLDELGKAVMTLQDRVGTVTDARTSREPRDPEQEKLNLTVKPYQLSKEVKAMREALKEIDTSNGTSPSRAPYLPGGTPPVMSDPALAVPPASPPRRATETTAGEKPAASRTPTDDELHRLIKAATKRGRDVIVQLEDELPRMTLTRRKLGENFVRWVHASEAKLWNNYQYWVATRQRNHLNLILADLNWMGLVFEDYEESVVPTLPSARTPPAYAAFRQGQQRRAQGPINDPYLTLLQKLEK